MYINKPNGVYTRFIKKEVEWMYDMTNEIYDIEEEIYEIELKLHREEGKDLSNI